MSNIHIVVMAGGSGTRFWPVSRHHHPKQLLKLGGGDTLLTQTFARVKPLAPPSRWWMVVGAAHADECAKAVPDLSREHVLVEPVARNTAAAIAYAAFRVRKADPDAVMVVLPADQYIRDPAKLGEALRTAVTVAERDTIVTLGIEPTHPETGYGYIERGDSDPQVPGAFAVKRFIEKPNKEKAIELVTSGGFDWNAGMFVMRPAVVEAEIERQLPKLHAGMRRLERTDDVEREYPTLESISVDHGLMEGAKSVAVVPVSCGWSDIGAWNAAGAVIDTDERNNVTLGRAVLVDTSDSIVYAENGHVVGVVGVQGLVVVHTKDATLVVPANRSQDVRAIVDRIKENGWNEYL